MRKLGRATFEPVKSVWGKSRTQFISTISYCTGSDKNLETDRKLMLLTERNCTAKIEKPAADEMLR